MDRSYWEQRKEQQTTRDIQPIAGTTTATTTPPSTTTTRPVAAPTNVQAVSGGASGNPLAESVRNSIGMFVKRLREVSSSGASVATDPVVLSLYQNLTAMQPQLLKQIDELQQQKGEGGTNEQTVMYVCIVGVSSFCCCSKAD